LLRNLNILLGLNGHGKSSFIQPLLLLRQPDKLSKGELKLSGGLVNTGTAKDVFYRYSPRQMSIALQLDNAELYQMNFDYLAETDLLQNSAIKDGCEQPRQLWPVHRPLHIKTKRQYALLVKTTGRNLRETNAIAEILAERYS
jgi:predicted ATPase